MKGLEFTPGTLNLSCRLLLLATSCFGSLHYILLLVNFFHIPMKTVDDLGVHKRI